MDDNYDKLIELFKEEKCKEVIERLIQECVEHIGRHVLTSGTELNETDIDEIELHKNVYKYLNIIRGDLIKEAKEEVK